MIDIGDKAPDLSLRDSDAEAITLASLWKRHPIALTFLRHAG
jgi:peroxiredoxin